MLLTFSFCLKSQYIRYTSETTSYTISENSLVFSGQTGALNSSNKNAIYIFQTFY